jgi:phosphoribosylaminoimidazole carboxylase PurK protein
MMERPKFDIGIVGGGQLGRMLTQAAEPMGLTVAVVDPAPHGNSPAAQVGAAQIEAKISDARAIGLLADASAVTTIEIEHVNAGALKDAELSGNLVHPSPETIEVVQDKFRQNKHIESLGIPVAPFALLRDVEDAIRYLEEAPDGRIVLKKRMGGFDGRGNAVVTSQAEVLAAWADLGRSGIYAEQFVPIMREIALQVAKSSTGDIASFDVVESIQVDGICDEIFTSDDMAQSVRQQAREYGEAIVRSLRGAGVFGVELFVTPDGQVIVNEIAPRVHNSGHYTDIATETSQFTQHLLAITEQPLGSPERVVPHAAMVNLLYQTDPQGLELAAQMPGVSVNMYGKEARQGSPRKIGHITTVGDTTREVRRNAHLARKLAYGIRPQ